MEITNDHEIKIDRALIREIMRRRRRAWRVTGTAIWTMSLAASLFFVPRVYKATTSIALQQASGPGAALSSLTGLGASGVKNYMGVLHSYRFADTAARDAGIQALYKLPSANDAAEMVEDAVSVDDKKDGLLYITVALPGPATLQPGASVRARIINAASKRLARTYANSLETYLATSNVDQDAVLIREAHKQLDQARTDYDNSVHNLTQYVHGHALQLVTSVPSTSSAKSTSSGDAVAGIGGELQALYLENGELESEIGAAKATQKGTTGLLGEPGGVDSLPSEDPLLNESRGEVTKAQIDLQNLRVSLADDNPSVVAARGRLAVAQARLRDESNSIKSGRTSEAIQMDALTAKKAIVMQQIAQAEKGFKDGSDDMTDLQTLRNEVELRLEVLKATATQSAVLSVQTLSGDNLMDVVDDARTPDKASPGVLILGVASLFLTFFVLGVWLGIDYLRLSKRAAPTQQVEADPIPQREAA